METIINQFPEYLPNQVLTEASLNATSDFLEQQERLTRFGLTKTGIIENLEFKINSNSIQIEEGFGVSIDGYFLAHHYKEGANNYEFAKAYQFDENSDMSLQIINDLRQVPFSATTVQHTDAGKVLFYELLTKEQSSVEVNSVAVSTLYSQQFKIVLYLEIKKIQQEQCSTTSCDTAGSMRTFRVVPLLVIDTEDILFKKINTEIKLKNRLKLKRLSNLYQLAKSKKPNEIYTTILTEYARVNFQNTRTLQEKLYEIETLWDYPVSLGDRFQEYNLKGLKAAIDALDLMHQTYISRVDYRNFPFNYGYIAQQVPKSSIPKATASFLKYTLALKTHSFKDKVRDEHPNAKTHFQAYYEFCADLEQAINELVVNYNTYVSRYSSQYSGRLKRMLVLGRNDKYNYDAYRYYPIENFANQDFREDKAIFFRHFNRVLILINKFQLGFGQLNYKIEIKLIPSRYGNYLLEDRAIPYYYKQDLELDAAWAVNSNKGLKTDIYQYRDLKAPYSHFAYSISSYNFIRVEGIIGKLVATNRLLIPWIVDFSVAQVETEKQQKKLVDSITKNLFLDANIAIKAQVQNKMKTDIASSAIDNLKTKLTNELKTNYTQLDAKIVDEMVSKVSVDLKDKMKLVNQTTKADITLNELDKQIDFFNIPLRYEIISLDNDHSASVLRQVESVSGTKFGGTIVLFTKKESAGERIIAVFMKYF